MLNHVYDFTPLIQLVAGVNFAFILGNFIEKAFEHIFNPNDVIDNMDENSRHIISIDLESLNALEPMETKDGRTNKKDLEELKKQYRDLNESWDKNYGKWKEYVEKVGQNKGFKLLFLLSSLYSLVVLFVSCFIHCGIFQLNGTNEEFAIKSSYAFFAITNTILCLIWSIRVFYGKVDDKPKEFVSLIKWIILALAVSVIGGLFLKHNAFLYNSSDVSGFNRVLDVILFYSSILLPFIALLMSVGYMVYCRTRVRILLWLDNKFIKVQLFLFRRDKKRIEDYYDRFTNNDIEF